MPLIVTNVSDVSFFASYASGRALLQAEGHPCSLERDYAGASECDDGLVCYDFDDPNSTRGTGECVRLSRRAAAFAICDADFGVDACQSGYTCQVESRSVVTAGRGRGRTSTYTQSRRSNVNVVRTGTCIEVRSRARSADTCDASLGNRACDTGYYCLGSNGVDLGGRGYGVCTRIGMNVRSSGVCSVGNGRDACARGYYCSANGLGRRMEVVGPGRRLEVTFNSEIPPAEAVSAPVDAAPAEEEARDLQQINKGGQCSLSFPCQGNDAGMCCSNHGFCGTGWDCECLPLFSPPPHRHPYLTQCYLLFTFQTAAQETANKALARLATKARVAALVPA